MAAAACLALSCASKAAPPPKAPSPDPAEEIVSAVTQALKLDALQQQRTRELLKALADRNDAIQASWAKGARVDPQALLASRAQFESEFFAILTPEQKRLYIETKMRLMMQSKLGGQS